MDNAGRRDVRTVRLWEYRWITGGVQLPIRADNERNMLKSGDELP